MPGGGDIFIYGGQAIVEWDSGTGEFSVPYYVPFDNVEIDNLKRSADRSWAIFSADKLYIYSASTDGFVSSIDPVNADPDGVRDVAANPDGSQFAVVAALSVSFYDGAFNLLGTVNFGPLADKLFDHGNTQYSADGSLLYWEMFGDQGGGSIIDVLDAINFVEMGSVGTNIGIALQDQPDLLCVTNEQQAFASLDGGIESLSVSSLRVGMPDMAGGGAPQPHAIPLNQSATVTLGALQTLLPVGMSVTFNGVLAPVESATSDSMVVQVPASSVAGPVNLVFTQPDGETLIEPQFFSYGVTIAAPTSTLIPPIGNPLMGLFGFGLLNDFSQPPPSVTIGGQTASVTVPDDTLDEIFVQIPNGVAGPADITVSGVNGTTTLKSAVTYVPSAKILPASGALVQLLYDTHRSLLYALQNNQIQVFNPITLTWNAPLLPGGSGGVGYVSMAITPDGSQLLVLDSSANTVTVFNPDNPSQSVSTPLNPGSGAILESVVATSTGEAFISSLYGNPIEFDLATNTYSMTNIFSALPSRFVATADGDYVAGINQNSGSGAINIWSRSGGGSGENFGNDVIWSDVAIAPGGNLYAAIFGDTLAAGIAAAFFDGGPHFIDVTVYPDLAPPDQPFCIGAIFSASGLTMLSPLADSIDFFSTQTATLRGRLLMPELLPVGSLTSGAIALDPNQQTIYAISASGLTVAALPSAVDQITPFPWPYVVKSSHSIPVGAAARSQHVKSERKIRRSLMQQDAHYR